MTILITGGGGYIGSHTILELQKLDYDVLVIDNFTNGNQEVVEDILKVPFVNGDIGDRVLVKKLLSGNHEINKDKPVEAIIHFAAFAYVSLSPIISVLFKFPSRISTTDVKCLGSGLQ